MAINKTGTLFQCLHDWHVCRIIFSLVSRFSLHSPVLQIAAFNDWEPFVLDDIIGAQSGDHGNLCVFLKQASIEC